MWNWGRWKEYGKPGGPGAVVVGFIAAGAGWYFFDLPEPALYLCAGAGYLVCGLLQWTNTITNGLWRIEEKLDDLESKIDNIESNTDKPNDRPIENDF